MVKFIIKKYAEKITIKNIRCDNCDRLILKNSPYYKHSGNQFHKLCNLCFLELSLESIKTHADNLTKG